jgi:hypothetical protein
MGICRFPDVGIDIDEQWDERRDNEMLNWRAHVIFMVTVMMRRGEAAGVSGVFSRDCASSHHAPSQRMYNVIGPVLIIDRV